MNRAAAIALLPKYKDTRFIDYPVSTNEALQQVILKCYPLAVQQCRALAQRFVRATDAATAEAVWHFLKNEIKYREDTGLDQKAKLPTALVTTGFGDCKSYTLFAAGVLASLGFEITIRFASYDGSTTPGHVYCLATKNGTTYIVDPVWRGPFNTEKKNNYHKDHTMRVSAITGINDSYGLEGTGPELVPGLGAAKRKEKRKKDAAKIKAVLHKAGTDIKKGAAHTAAKVKTAAKKYVALEKTAALAAPRNAFLLLVDVNALGFATILSQKNKTSLYNTWRKLGGNTTNLQRCIDLGKKKKPLLRKGDTIGYKKGMGIGEPVTAATVTTVLVAATPIMLVLNEFLKASKSTVNILSGKADGTTTNTDTPPTPYTGSGTSTGSDTGGGVVPGSDTGGVDTGGGSKTMLYMAIAVGALFLLTKK